MVTKQVPPTPKDREEKDSEEKQDYYLTQLHNYFSEEDHDIIIDGENARIVRRNIEHLSETIERHFTIISAAFPHLAFFLGQEALKDQFITDTVLIKQGWDQHRLGSENLKLTDLKVSSPRSPLPKLTHTGSSLSL